MTAERISVVLPVYNERENIAPCLTGLARALEGVEHEILVCYDFDEDTTLEGIRAMGAAAPKSVQLVKNTLGRGPHNALKAGFQAASGDVVVTTMADLSDPPELIPLMAARVRAGCDVVSGSRYMHGGTQKGGPLLKRSMSRVAGVSLAWIAGMGTHDATSNFRAYSTRFLRATVIEATAGFEIALELTVKAHLEGRGVGEVASSWVDRAAGQSRFRMWKWLPNYLRWYARAMREPVGVWAVWASALLFALWSLGGPEHELARVVVWSAAALAAAGLVGARTLRGRSRWSDALIPVAALAPPALLASTGATLALLAGRLIVVLALVVFTTPRERVASAARAAARRLDQRGLGLLLLVLLVWSAHLAPVVPSAGAELDPSWQQSLGRALREELRFGTQIHFTYGPLGWFLESPYDAGLFWTKALLFEAVFKLGVAALIVAAALRIPGLLERGLFLFAAIVPMGGNDAWAFLAIASATALLCASPQRGVLRESLILALLAVLALIKFTYFLYAALALALFAAWCWRTRGMHRALRTPVLFLALVVLLWTGLGQSPLDLPAYVASSLSITSGYSSAMGHSGDHAALELGLRCTLVVLLASAIAVARPWRRGPAPVLALVVAAGVFLAFKAGFVRSAGNAVTFFAFAAGAPFLLATLDARAAEARFDGARRVSAAIVRTGGLVLALFGYGIAREHPGETFERLFVEWSHEAWTRTATTLDPAGKLAELREENANRVEQTALPHVRARAGSASVDLIPNAQGVLHANGLAWKPRPAFQSYVAYTPELLERNARFLAGPDAPEFVLFQFETIDRRLPQLDDALAMQVLSRDWKPVLEEGGFLLLERRSRPSTAPAAPARPVELERALRFGEWLELGESAGRCRILTADIRPTLRGRLSTLGLRAPVLWMDVEDTEKRKATFRVVPSILARGVMIAPFLLSTAEWMSWYSGEPCANVKRLRIVSEEPTAPGALLEETIGVRVERADDLVPEPVKDVERIDRFPMFDTVPLRVTTRFPWYTADIGGETVLVVHAPADVAYDLRPGRWRLTGRYGILDEAWEKRLTDGVNFALVTLDDEGKEHLPLFKRLLDPVNKERDRGAQELDLQIELPHRALVYLRTRPGPLADTNSDWAWWTKLRFTRVGAVAPR